jgi:site-specific DNA-methyltransferase (adenine-specific)
VSVAAPLRRNIVLVGDARQRLEKLPHESVDCVVTSPPYFNLRDYGDPAQLGLEDHVDEWVEHLRLVMGGLARVLKQTGSVWLNVADSFSRNGHAGAPTKSLLLGPERLVLALLDDGWLVRNRVTWVKPNPLPSSVQDRLACRWEVVYLLTRARHYYFDLDAVRVPHRSTRRPTSRRSIGSYPPPSARPPDRKGDLTANTGLERLKVQGMVGHPLGKNPGDVWTLPSAHFRGQHFATFPEALVTLPLLATCPERVCRACGKPWNRRAGRNVLGELYATCECRASWQPGIVLDPFFGAGTVGVVAERYGRDWLGIELNPAFASLSRKRIQEARASSDKRTARRKITV